MVDDRNTLNISGGMDVFGSDGEKVGSVAGVESDYMVVSKGFFFPTDYSIPTSAINSADADGVYLNVTKDEALNQGWEAAPDTTTTSGDESIVDAGLHVDNPVPATSAASNPDLTTTAQGEYIADDIVTEGTDYQDDGDDDAIRVQLAEEDLAAQTREVDRGAVHVDKVVTEREQSLDVPVTEEKVTVNRRSVDRDVEPGDTTFEEGTIEVPVRGEEVVVDKQTHVREEIEVGKEQVTETQRVTDTVRREEARIRDEQGNLIEDDDPRNTR